LLDTTWIDVTVKLILFFLSCLKNVSFATSVLLILENLFLGFSVKRIFPWSRQHVSALLNTVGLIDATAAKLDSAPKIYSQLVLNRYRDVTPGSEGIETEIAGVSRRSLVVVVLRCRDILSHKVSRYISQSVFNI
jgi:hypothetical protein